MSLTRTPGTSPRRAENQGTQDQGAEKPARRPAGKTPAPGSRGGAEPRRWRRWGWPLVIVATVVAVGLLTASLLRTAARDDLDPRSATPGGSRAVAQILGAHGIRVEVATRSDAAVAGAGRDTTIVVVNPSLLGPLQLDRLRRTPADLVLVEPDMITLDRLAPVLSPAGPVKGRQAAPVCDDADAVVAGTASAGGLLYTHGQGQDGAVVGCYPDVQHPDRYSLARLVVDSRRVTVIGQREVLQNGSLAVGGNAALALHLLGARPTLRWYLPDPTEISAGPAPPQLPDLLPPWIRWAGWQLAITLVVILLWRGRRFGRVVTEPLPVIVRSAETVEGRARLYRAGRSRHHAAAVLRTAAARRLAARLNVPGRLSPAEVAWLTAQASRTDPGQVHATLLGKPPADDAALVALAGALDALEQAVAGHPGATGSDCRSRTSGTRKVSESESSDHAHTQV